MVIINQEVVLVILQVFFGIDIVPIIMEGNLQKGIDFVKTKLKSTIEKSNIDGLVVQDQS